MFITDQWLYFSLWAGNLENIQSLRLRKKYKEDVQFINTMRLFLDFTFVSEEHIFQHFNIILRHINQNSISDTLEFVEYFRKTFVGVHEIADMSKPLFEIIFRLVIYELVGICQELQIL